MEIPKEFSLKLKTYEKAISGFNKLLNKDLSMVKDDVLLDGLKNGQAQKFEYCAELTWKMIKKFLYHVDGVDAKSPKECCKQFFLNGHLTEEDYLLLIEMIDDRNALSHVYSDEEFDVIHQKLPRYRNLIITVLTNINDKITCPAP